MSDTTTIAARASTKSAESANSDLPRRLAELEAQTADRKAPAATLAPLWFEIGELRHALAAYEEAVDAFKRAAKGFRTEKTAIAIANAVRARVGEASAVIQRGRPDDAGKARRILDGLKLEGCAKSQRLELEARIHQLSGLAAFHRRDRKEARRRLLLAVKGARAIRDRAVEAEALDSLSDFYRHYGEAGRSEAYLFKALELKRDLGDLHGQAVTLGLLGRLCLDFERYPSAQHYFEEDLSLSRDVGDNGRAVRTMGLIGKAMVGQGKLDQAGRKLKMGLMVAKRREGTALEAEILKDLAEVARRSGKMAEARKRLDMAARTYLDAESPEGAAVADCMRANIHFEEGDPKAAAKLLATATDVLRKHHCSNELVPALGLMAQVHREVGERDQAIAVLREAVDRARSNHLFRNLETLERERFRLEHSRPDSGGDENSIRFFREFCLHGLRGAVKEYRVVREIGTGTAGVVFEAFDETLARPVAIKMLKPELSRKSQLVARFRRELEIVGLVDHPGVMKIYACGRNDDRFFYVTDYLPGPSLKTLIETSGKLSAVRALPLMARVADAVAAVHGAGVVHRDLKPGNVILDADGDPVVVDFGIAGRRGKLPSAEVGAVMGTFLYMPLEQMNTRAKPALEWDVFALGVTFYEALTGRMPYPARSFPELVDKLKAGKVAPMRMSAKTPPAAVKRLITAMLAREPGDRPSAAEVAEALALPG